MKRTLLILLLLFPLTTIADLSGLYYNADRAGEGASVFTLEDRSVLLFYTYRDAVISPVVSPPAPPVSIQCANQQMWYIAQMTWEGDYGEGVIYSAHAIDYPAVIDGYVSTLEVIGEAYMVKMNNGFDILVEYVLNDSVHNGAYLYGTHEFRTVLVETVNE